MNSNYNSWIMFFFSFFSAIRFNKIISYTVSDNLILEDSVVRIDSDTWFLKSNTQTRNVERHICPLNLTFDLVTQ